LSILVTFLKGAVDSLYTEKGYVSQDEYQNLGRKRVLHDNSEKLQIYNLFLEYEKIKTREGLYDMADAVFAVFR
jgi:hypothetical protein